MKLEEVHVVKSMMGDEIYICTVNKRDKRLMNQKVDRTNEIIKAIIDRWCGYEEVIDSLLDGKCYRIRVQEIKMEVEKDGIH